jgi:hypothetical protein
LKFADQENVIDVAVLIVITSVMLTGGLGYVCKTAPLPAADTIELPYAFTA